MQTASVKQAVHELADQLSDNATWDDIVYSIYLRQSIEKGLKDIEDGKTISHLELKNKWKAKLADKMG